MQDILGPKTQDGLVGLGTVGGRKLEGWKVLIETWERHRWWVRRAPNSRKIEAERGT
jgi:hypothetical protein